LNFESLFSVWCPDDFLRNGDQVLPLNKGVRNLPPGRTRAQNIVNRSRRDLRKEPFWLPAISYYLLSFAISLVIFFLIWGTLFEGGEEMPWVTAGIFASLLMVAAVIVREVVLRNARLRYLEARRRLDSNLRQHSRRNPSIKRSKLSLTEHAVMLDLVLKKSQAARVLDTLSDGHKEVAAACEDYLVLTEEELRRTDVNSPRFSAMRKGRRGVKKLHRHHLLMWSEIESKALSLQARSEVAASDRISLAKQAIEVVNSALRYYPDEKRLSDSVAALKEYISAVGIADLFESAGELELEGKTSEARAIYEDMARMLPEECLEEKEKALVLSRIETKLGDLETGDDLDVGSPEGVLSGPVSEDDQSEMP